MIELPPPVTSCDPFDWMGYADNLMERGDPTGPDVLCIYHTLVAFEERKLDARRLLIMRASAMRLPGERRFRGYMLFQPDKDPLDRIGRYATRLWVNGKGAAEYYHLPSPVDPHLCRPWDVVNLPERYPDVVWAYLRRLTADAMNAGWVKKEKFMG